MSTFGYENDFIHMNYVPSDISDIVPYEYFLKQSGLIINHYLDAKNECLSILKKANIIIKEKEFLEKTLSNSVHSFCKQKIYSEDISYGAKSQTENKDVTCNRTYIQINKPLNCESSSLLSFIKQEKTFCKTIVKHSAVPKSKSTSCVKSSALCERFKLKIFEQKRKLYFLSKNIGFITFNVQDIYFKLKEMNSKNNFINNLKAIANCNEYTQDDNKVVKKAPKVLVEKTSASNICFGNISALADLNIDICHLQNPCHEISLTMQNAHDLREFQSELDQENSNTLNGRFVIDEGYEMMSGSDDNLSRKKFQPSNDNKMNYSRNKIASKYAKIRSRKSYRNTAFYKISKLLRHQNTYFLENPASGENIYTSEHLALIKKDLQEGKGPTATVVLNRLSSEYIQKATSIIDNKVFRHVEESSAISGSSMRRESYHKPSYILNGLGVKLKDIPKVKDNILGASARAIRLIHHILFGTVEKDRKSRLNILEFNGYSDCQKNFMEQMSVLLKKMLLSDIKVICKIFLIRATGQNKPVLIKLLFQFLETPSPVVKKRNAKTLKLKRPYRRLKNMKFKKNFTKSSTQENENPLPMPVPAKPGYKEIASEAFDYKPSLTLRNLEKISFNVECAAPEDLTELNDLLFIKPSDSTEIHQQILDFTYFAFSENSIEYHYRKTLLHYMNFSIIKKIALLLDIKCEESSSHQELSSLILKFLMEPIEIGTKFERVNNSSNLPATRNHQTENKPKFDEEKNQVSMKNKNVALKSEAVQSPLHRSDHAYSFSCTTSKILEEAISNENKEQNCNAIQMSNVVIKETKTECSVNGSIISPNSSATQNFSCFSTFVPPKKVETRKNPVYIFRSPVALKNGIFKLTSSPLITKVQALKSN